MFYHDFLTMMVMGGFFVVLGLTLFISGKIGEKSYHDPSVGMDVRGYLEQDVQPKYESLKVGGRISIAVGLLMLAMSGAFWLWD